MARLLGNGNFLLLFLFFLLIICVTWSTSHGCQYNYTCTEKYFVIECDTACRRRRISPNFDSLNEPQRKALFKFRVCATLSPTICTVYTHNLNFSAAESVCLCIIWIVWILQMEKRKYVPEYQPSEWYNRVEMMHQ